MKRILFIIMVVSVILNINAMFLYSETKQQEIYYEEEEVLEGGPGNSTGTGNNITAGGKLVCKLVWKVICDIVCLGNPQPYNGEDCHKECRRILVNKTCRPYVN